MLSESTQSNSKEARISLRASAEDKMIIERAAKLRGMKVSQFILKNAVKRAEKILEEEKTMLLKGDDKKAFVNAFLEIHKPTPYLTDAINTYKKG